MAKPFRANINPAVLKWARESANVTPEHAAKRAGVKTQIYLSWENPNSDQKPTIRQLRTVANVFHRPVSLFYLSEVPVGFQPLRDFRRLPDSGRASFTPELTYEMELAQQRRELSLELAIALGDRAIPFNLRATIEEDPELVGERIRKALDIRFLDQVHWWRKGRLEPFKVIRQAIEDSGVLVFQMSRVNSSEACGFALASNERPLIAVNGKDVPNRRTFSLMHEFAHLLLGKSGASYLELDTQRPLENQDIEVFCNAVAAAALIPRERLLAHEIVQTPEMPNGQWNERELKDLARTFGISRDAILRRLLTLQRTTRRFYQLKSNEWEKERQKEQERRERERQEGGRNFRRNPPREIYIEMGRPLIRQVLESVNSNYLTLHEASGYLGDLRMRHFGALEQHVSAD